VIGDLVNKDDPIMVAELINEESRGWKETEVQNLFEDHLANEILAIPISPTPKADTLVWKGNKSRLYMVKSSFNRVCARTTETALHKASSSFQPS